MKRMLKVSGLLLCGGLLGAVLYAYSPLLMHGSSVGSLVNFLEVSPRIHTSGQPSAAQLRGLHTAGYGLVVNLAPAGSHDAIAEEGSLLALSGISYVNIPTDWHQPRYEDFHFFSNVLAGAGSRRILVHCQLNMRASVFTFLYRVIYEKADPAWEYTHVTGIWEPNDEWKAFTRLVLSRHKIQFEIQ
jgi:protein tyrosine phosphatase (PTP) superfamily phosphohydrolase (DUF442 family)